MLAPGEDPNAAAAEDARRKAELEKARRANLCQYEITTKTSNIKWVRAHNTFACRLQRTAGIHK